MSRFDFGRFKQPPDDEFVCGICKNVLDDPKESPCRHVFCKVCITRALQEKSKCPICRTSFRERHLKDVLPLVKNLLNKLQMECENKDNGCEAPLSLEVYINHVSSCDFTMVSCKNEFCNQKFLKRDIELHECQYKTYVCNKGCECDVLVCNKDTHNCLEALLKKSKEENKKIQQLEEKVKELEAKMLDDVSSARARDSFYRDLWSSGNSSTWLNSDPSPSGSPFSYNDLNYPLSLSSASLSDTDRLSPSISLSVSDHSDNNNGEWSPSRRRHDSASNEYNGDGGNANNDGAEEAEIRFPLDLAGDGERGHEEGDNSRDSLSGSAHFSTFASDNEQNRDNINISSDSESSNHFQRRLYSDTPAHRFTLFGHSDQSEEERGASSSSRKRMGRNNEVDDGESQGAKRARLEAAGQSTSTAGVETEADVVSVSNEHDEDIEGSLRRSARLRNIPATPVEDDGSNDLETPNPTSALLRLYSNDHSSSSDNSWSPYLDLRYKI